MSDKLLSNLDKLLTEFVFQVQQTSYATELVKQQIYLYTANITEKKKEISRLHENINKSNDAVVHLHKHRKNCKENCNAWKPTYVALSKHEEYLKNQLKIYQETTENDRKMYQDYIIQYNNILKQHQEKYSETALSQEYYMKKRDLEEIRNRVLKHSEQFKSKEAALLDMLEPAPFQSLSDWALKIVSMRQKTQQVLKHTAVLTQKSLKLEKEADELEMKINNLKQPFERTTANQNHSEITDGKYKRNLEQRKQFKERVLEENENPYLVHEKQQQQQPLHLPSIPQKFVQSIRTFRQSLQETQAVGEERENPMDHSAITSVSSSQLENETQKCNDTTRTNHPKIAQVPSRENQMQFRLLSPQKQTTSKQWFENEAVITANKDAECGGKEEASRAKDSLHVSQNIPTESFRSTEDNPNTAEEGTVNFPRTPEMPAFIRTPESNEKKAQFPKTPPFELSQNLGSQKARPKSPAFSFFMASTEKSPGFKLLTQKSLKLEKEADELEMKINNLKEPFKRSTKNQNHSEITDGKYKRNLEQRKEFKERVFEESENPYLVHEKQQQQQPLHLPSIPQKFVQSIRTFRQSLQETQAVGEERENPMDHSAITSVSSSQLENETQKCSDTTRTNHPKIAQVPSRENQMQFRLLSPQKQTTSKQWFENEAVITANKDAECGGREEASKAKDSLHVSQNIPTESFRSTEDNPNTAEEGTVNFPRTPEMPAFIRTPESNEKKAQFPKTPPFELNQNSGSEKATPKSPAFSFFMACTEKSPGFNLFDPSVFGAENSSDQMDESYSAGNVNPVSPHKDIGSLFGKSESEDGFTFSFPSESSSNTFGDGKDDFSFLFAFGQDQRSSQSSSMKGFHSSSQSTKPFTFF